MNKKVLFNSLSIVFAVLVWQILSWIVDAEFLLASPISMCKKFFQIIMEKDFLITIFFSFLRISAGFLSALIFGVLLAVAAGRFRFVEHLLFPYVITIKSVPIASFIILCLIWFTFDTLTVFISFLISFPVIYSNVLQGIKNADNNLVEVADLYNVSFAGRLKYIYIPSIKPFLISACSVAVGMAWKAGVAAEVIGVIKGSIGGKLYESKIYFQNADLLAWTLVIIIISVISEKFFVFLLKRLFRRIEKV